MKQMGLLRNAIFRHPDSDSERSEEEEEGSYQRRDSSAFGLRMTQIWAFRNSPQIRKLRVFLFLFLVVFGIGCVVCPQDAVSADYLLVHFLDVGYGDSILIEFPDGKNILIDSGGQEAGASVSDYLKERKIEKIDLALVTHPHSDHMEGFFLLAQRYKIGGIAANEDISESKNYAPLFEVVKGLGIEFRLAKKGDIVYRFKEGEVEVFHPDKLTGDWNNDSLVVKLTYKKVSFLFTADIGQEVCDRLASHYQERLKSAVLKIPHHGKSWGGEFIKKVSPEVAVLSVGPSIWGGASEEVLAQYRDSNIPVLRTDEKGAVVIKTDGEKIWF